VLHIRNTNLKPT